jgi:ABC-type polysaccharide/polyol phosphate transport system ATPase subunit
MIAGIYRPTSGTIKTRGRVAALIEIGAGFHPDMTGRENIKLNGTILGLGAKEIEAATDEIIDFSGLRPFINDPVKHYSSGMYVRLGFSVAVHMKPDVLLVDEVLAVGDEEFQRKCLDHISGLRKSGTTIIIVSHSLGQIEAMCDEATWLDHGIQQATGSPSKVSAAYIAQVNAEEAKRNPNIVAIRPDDEGGARAGDQSIRLRRAAIVDLQGKPINHAETDTSFEIAIDLTAREPILGPNVRIALQHESGPLITMLSNHRSKVDFGMVDGDNTVTLRIPDNPLLPGRYKVHIDVFDHTGSRTLDTWSEAVEFAVRSPRGEISQGFFQLPVDFRIEPASNAD